MKILLIISFLFSIVCGSAQGLESVWNVRYENDTTIVDFGVNSKNEVICLAYNKETERYFVLIHDPSGKLIHSENFDAIEMDYFSPDVFSPASKLEITAQDEIIFFGRTYGKYYRIVDYKTEFAEDTKENTLFMARLDKQGKMRQLTTLLTFEEGMRIDIHTACISGSGESVVSVFACRFYDGKEQVSDLKVEKETYRIYDGNRIELVIKLDAKDQYMWHKVMSRCGYTPFGNQAYKNLAMDEEGAIYFICEKWVRIKKDWDSVSVNNAVICKMDKGGKNVWEKTISNDVWFFEIHPYNNKLILLGEAYETFEVDKITVRATTNNKTPVPVTLLLNPSGGKVNNAFQDSKFYGLGFVEDKQSKTCYYYYETIMALNNKWQAENISSIPLNYMEMKVKSGYMYLGGFERDANAKLKEGRRPQTMHGEVFSLGKYKLH